MKINCIIVEDEPLAIEVIEDYIHQIPFLALIGSYNNAISTMEILKSDKVDLMFLDLHLPKIKGLEFLNIITPTPQVIITTAYPNYALESYEHNVVDYLLKPIEFNRFLLAVNKVRSIINTKNEGVPTQGKDFLFFNVNKKMIKVYFDHILYIESLKEYIKVVTTNGSILTKYSLAQLDEELPKDKFIRTHRSFIVSKNKINAYSTRQVEISGKQTPIGRNFKDSFLQEMRDEMNARTDKLG